MAKDRYHLLVKNALIREGWAITHDPYPLRDWDPNWEIDLGAEKIIGAEKENQKIAIEVKSFLETSFAYEFHKALGQYLNYFASLSQLEKDRVLFLAIPLDIWETEFQRHGIQFSIKTYNVKILIYNVKSQCIERWIM
jgi:XisH protein